jgi:two-component system, cell cycle sensor histidine kinase and response regulator CckA
MEVMRATITTKRPVRGLVIGVLRPPAVERRWILINAEPRLDTDGDVEEVLCTLQDMTERRALDEQLRQSQRMEAVGQLAGGIAHDFNNLLMAISGYAEMVKRGLLGGTAKVADLDQILTAVRRATTLIQQLLAFGRRQVLRPTAIDVNEVVRDSESLLRQLVRSPLEFYIDLSPDSQTVLVDRGQLEQIILNLVLNARDAMPQGGSLWVSTRTVTPGAPLLTPGLTVPALGAVLLVVRDSGVGMSESVRARVFEPFFTTKAVGKGTGLGLSSVYGTVRQSRGEVWIESEPGNGTTVYVMLPATAAPRVDV